VDEWGVWDKIPPEDEKQRGKLWQQITMRSAVGAALGLNLFHRQAAKLVMCNIAQIVNVLHSLILTDGPQCVRTSTYYAYELMKAHRGRQAVVVENEMAAPLDLSVSASRSADEAVVSFVNPAHDTPMMVSCALEGAKAGAVEARLLHHADWNAANTFDRPDTIVPQAHAVEQNGGVLRFTLPALSVLTLRAKVG